MQGSDGVTLDGMYHEEHALPAFVHSRGKDQLRLRSVVLKGETPVVYFYTPTKQRVRVHVAFPRGIWTQWYPQASMVSPQHAQVSSPPRPENGRIMWNAEVIPASAAPPPIPQTPEGALWNFARDVDAAYVRTAGEPRASSHEYERYLFYRGLGEAPLPLTLTASASGTLRYAARERQPLRHLLVLRVDNGKGAYRYIPSLAPGGSLAGVIPDMGRALPLEEFTGKVADELAARLTEEGLFPREARAMVNTWRSSYFGTDGVRVLFVLPREWTDRVIPMRIDPRPAALVRVMVGRLELLTPERERRAERAVRDLASPDSAVREAAFEYLREQGRYVEPVIRRTERETKDEAVRRLCKRLLLSDFVTELRAAAHATPDGQRLYEQPVHVRAQLASLLREVGLDREAKEEAAAAAAELKKQPTFGFEHHEARHQLRAHARVMEGLGREADAAEAYGRFVRFGAQVATRNDCTGCHNGMGNGGPDGLAWFKGWWAGRKFAEHTARTRGAAAAIAGYEKELAARPSDPTTRLLLAYLYEVSGQHARANGLWDRMGAPSRLTAR
jgi:hypothetical protein